MNEDSPTSVQNGAISGEKPVSELEPTVIKWNNSFCSNIYNMDSILLLSKRTISKIMTRMKLGCSLCGWNDAICDFHHIIPRKLGGNDNHDNITYICPNCHRKAHHGLIIAFITASQQIGDQWKMFYFPQTKNPNAKPYESKIERAIKQKERFEKLHKAKQAVLLSKIDFSKYGWVSKVSKLINICPQNVSSWMQKNLPDIKTFKRNG